MAEPAEPIVPNPTPEPTPTPTPEPTPEPEGSEKRYKADMLRYKSDNVAAQEENAKLKQQIEDRNIADLEGAKKHEEVAKHYKEENEKLKTRLNETVKTVVDDKKYNAIDQEARAQGMNEKAIKLLKSGAYDTSSVIIETTSENNINVLGAKEFITDLKQKEDWLFTDQVAPVINGGTNLNSTITGDTITAKDMLDLQKKDRAKYQEIVLKSRKGEIKIIR